jgi:hypothetical protein
VQVEKLMDPDSVICVHVLFYGADIAEIWAESEASDAPVEACCAVCARISQAMYLRTAAGQA